jgi:CheY-like chemotaxis protein
VDVELPDGDGFTLAGELTAMPWRPRVVVTSVLAANGSRSQAQRSGAQAFVPKADLARAPLAQWLGAV